MSNVPTYASFSHGAGYQSLNENVERKLAISLVPCASNLSQSFHSESECGSTCRRVAAVWLFVSCWVTLKRSCAKQPSGVDSFAGT
eukprot:2436066-Prymnesium_polylepis.2